MIINKHNIIKLSENLSDITEVKGRSLWQDALSRFLKNKAAVISLATIFIILLFSFLGPYFAIWDNEEIDWNVLGDIATNGNPSFDFPNGTDMPGMPANEAGTVKISFRYILIGSSSFSPIGNAGLGVVGVNIISQFLKAVAKSSAINFLTFCAFI